jgi:hypothetical protein
MSLVPSQLISRLIQDEDDNFLLKYSNHNLCFLFWFGSPLLFVQTNFLNLGKPHIDHNPLKGNVNCVTAFFADVFSFFLVVLNMKMFKKIIFCDFYPMFA